jgi:hypothetical protein
MFYLEWRNFCINSLKYITEQPSDMKYLIPSLITLNTKRLLNIYESKLNSTDNLPKVNLIFNNKLNYVHFTFILYTLYSKNFNIDILTITNSNYHILV